MTSVDGCHCHEIPGLGHCNWIIGAALLGLFVTLHVAGLVISRRQRDD